MLIETLGRDFAANGDVIIETERLLGRLIDTELWDKLEDYKVNEILHAEHLSPHFLDICKKQCKLITCLIYVTKIETK